MLVTYRADIDGLRAVAVLSVVASHYGASWLPGGFTGVDVFFVISGYLITQGLVSDIALGGNWIGRFYDRRIRRLAPALITVLCVSLLAGHIILMPGDFAKLGMSSAYSAFGLGNVFFYWNTGYFDREAELQPLLHLWSLGVEEQFYILWPILLAALALMGRRVAVISTALIIIASIVLAQHQLTADPKAAFYLPFSRAWELAVGAAMVFVPAIKARALSSALVIIGLIAITASLLFVTPTTPFPGIAAVPAVMGAALLVMRKGATQVDALLSNRFMVGIGLLSYSLYLWHWPVFVFYRHYINGAIPSWIEAWLLSLVSLALAFLTWKYIEPMRRLRAPISKVLISGAVLSSVIAGVGIAIAKSEGLINRFPSYARSISSLDEMWKWDGCRYKDIPDGFPKSTCIFGSPWETARTKGLVWGDSHAQQFAPLIEAILPPDTSVALVEPCPAPIGHPVRRVWLEVPNYVELCRKNQDTVVSLLNSGEIDWVAIAAAWVPLPDVISQDGSLPKELKKTELLQAGLIEVLSRIKTDPKITLIGQTPSNKTDPAPCALDLPRRNCSQQALLSALFRDQYINKLDAMLTRVAEKTGVGFLPTSSILCSELECQPNFDGEPLYRDFSHIRRNLPINIRRKLAVSLGFQELFPSGPDAVIEEPPR